MLGHVVVQSLYLRGYETFAHNLFLEVTKNFVLVPKKGYEKFSQGQGEHTKNFGIYFVE